MSDGTHLVETSETYEVSVSPSIDIPTRTVRGFEISELGRVDFGDTLTAVITAPDGEHNVEVRRPYEGSDVYGLYLGEGGETERSFDTSEMPGTGDPLTPGTYLVIAVVGGNNLKAVGPFVVQSHTVDIDLPPVFEPGEAIDVTVDIEPIPTAPEVSVDDAEFRIWSDTEDTTEIELTAVDETTYEGTITDPPAETFNAYAAATRRVPEFDEIDSEAIGLSDKEVVEEAVDTLAVQAESPLAGRAQFARPTVTDSYVICGGLGSEMRAYEPSAIGSDTVAWSFERAGALSDSSPVVVDGMVYVGSGGGVLYALDASTGTKGWTFPEDESSGESAITATPTVASGRVYVGSNDGTVRAIDADEHNELWRTDAGAPVYARSATSPDRVFVTTIDGELLALRREDGSVAWSYEADGRFGASGPVYQVVGGDGGTVYAAAENVLAFDASTSDPNPEPLWTTARGGTTGSSPVISNGTLYIGGADGRVYALDADPAGSGAVEWTHEAAAPIPSTPTIVDGRVLVCSLAPRALLLDGDTGEPRAAASLAAPARTEPLVDGGTVYLGTDHSPTGTVTALEIDRL